MLYDICSVKQLLTNFISWNLFLVSNMWVFRRCHHHTTERIPLKNFFLWCSVSIKSRTLCWVPSKSSGALSFLVFFFAFNNVSLCSHPFCYILQLPLSWKLWCLFGLTWNGFNFYPSIFWGEVGPIFPQYCVLHDVVMWNFVDICAILFRMLRGCMSLISIIMHHDQLRCSFKFLILHLPRQSDKNGLYFIWSNAKNVKSLKKRTLSHSKEYTDVRNQYFVKPMDLDRWFF